MANTLQLPKTLQEAVAFFSDPQRTFDYAVKLRWPDGKVTCPRCQSTEHSFVSTRRLWFCKDCKKQFTVKVGTIFEDSALGMDKWMIAVWLIVNAKNGISSYEVARALGITQKSAWFMMHRVRLAMQDKSIGKLGGPGVEVEADETFIGGKARNMHSDKRRARITLLSYDGLRREFAHKIVDHAEKYVDGRIHTNGLENFWSLLKRGINGTYVSVEPFHLFRYLDEQSFRYNNRATRDRFIGDGDRFQMAMRHIAGRRITYEQLTGKGTDTVHHETAGPRPS